MFSLYLVLEELSGQQPIFSQRLLTVSMSDEHMDAYTEHCQALQETGFWGKQGAGALVLSRKTGRLLIQQRSELVLEPLTWGTWGGAVDPEESPVEALIRELKEEGVLLDPKGSDVYPAFVFRHPSGFTYHNFIVVVDDEFDPMITDETHAYQWTTEASLPTPLHPGLSLLLSDPNTIELIESLRPQSHYIEYEGPSL